MERYRGLGDIRAAGQLRYAIPKKGDAKLLEACRLDVPDMPARLIFALFDADKLHRRLFPSGRPPDEALLEELRRRAPA